MLMFFIKFFLVSFGILFIFLDIKSLIMILDNNIVNLLIERQNELLNIGAEFNRNYQGFNTVSEMSSSLSLVMDTVLFKVLPLESLVCFVIVIVLNSLDHILDYLTYVLSFKWLRDLFTFNWFEIIGRTFKLVGRFYGTVLITFTSYAEPLSNAINSLITTI